MSEKLKFEVKGGVLNLGVDADEDGEKSLEIKLHLTEAVQEAFDRGTPLEGAKLVDFKFEGTKLVLKLDTDKDGEALLEFEVNLAEAIDEIFKKKDSE